MRWVWINWFWQNVGNCCSEWWGHGASPFALSFGVFTDGYGQRHCLAGTAPYYNSSSFLFSHHRAEVEWENEFQFHLQHYQGAARSGKGWTGVWKDLRMPHLWLQSPSKARQALCSRVGGWPQTPQRQHLVLYQVLQERLVQELICQASENSALMSSSAGRSLIIRAVKAETVATESAASM